MPFVFKDWMLSTIVKFKTLLATSLMVVIFIGSAAASEEQLKLTEIKNPDLVQIQPGQINGEAVDIVRVGNLPEFAVRAELRAENLSQGEKEKLSEIRRDILDKVVTGLLLGASELPMTVSDESVIKVSSNKQTDSLDFFNAFRIGVLAKKINGESEQVEKQRKTLRERAASLIAFLNENILRSTYKAGKDFVHDTKGTKGYKEFGISLVFRGELQIGAGKTNIMRTIARGVDIGYDIKSKELVIRTVKRKEKMDGGTAMALGPKMELRAYRANLDVQEHASNEGHVHGRTWYPPAPPLLTFASESFPGYHSVGTALAFNVFDVVVPTFLFNTVNEFDADYQVKRVSLSPTVYLRKALAALRLTPVARPSANQCQAIFSRAY